MMKAKYEVEPDLVQKLSAFVTFPFTLKVIFGFISDNIPIYGSNKKAYLVLASSLQFVAMTTVTFYPEKSLTLLATCVFLSYLSVAFADVVVDSLMVINARRDPKNGSSHLQHFVWTCQAVGGIISAIIAGVLTQRDVTPLCFGIYAVFGIIMFFLSMLLDKNVEYGGQ